MINIFVYFVPN